jgi:hypothetical protein
MVLIGWLKTKDVRSGFYLYDCAFGKVIVTAFASISV